MLTRWNSWNELEDMFAAMSQLRTTMDRMFDDAFAGRALAGTPALPLAGTWPRANLLDAGASLVLTAEVPGLSEKDLELSLDHEVLTISGQRDVSAPQGYTTHRQERAGVRFSRSFALPCKVNAERTSATVKNGILTVTLEKAADAMPKQITVKAA